MRKNFESWGRLLLAGASVLALLCGIPACEPEDLPVTFAPQGTGHDGGEYAELPLRIEPASGYGTAPTKTSLLYNAELKRSGVLLLVYRSSTRQLDSYHYFSAAELDAAEREPLKIAVPLTDCDFYLLGNLHAVHRTTGETRNLADALGEDFPVDESELEAFGYRLDGGALNEEWRRETMAEVQTYGLPFACIEKDVDVRRYELEKKSVPQGRAVWLFSKVVIKVDHRLFDGGDADKLDYFVNKEMYVRQANLRLQPFSEAPCKAEAEPDSGDGDYDAGMSNAGAGEYVVYLPENMQGTVPGIATGAGKNKDNTEGIPAAVRDYASYVEFRGTLSREAGGFGGDVTYQFYLGANETTDFNLRRGCRYDVTLSFTAGALFGPPEWKVHPELTDDRLFRLTADADFRTDIGEVNASRTLAVRKNRPGRFYLYMNPFGMSGAANSLIGKRCEAPASFVMSDLSDCAWYGELMTPGTEDARWLSDRGLRAEWDADGASLTFSVSDASKFEEHKGESRSFELRLLPGGTMRSTFQLRLLDDLALHVADGKSLTDEFYLGQKRSISVTGLAGTDVRYAAVQEQCGASASADLNANVQWKTDNGAGPFPKCALDAAGQLSLDPRNGVYAAQRMTGGRLDIYAFYPNRFQPAHGWSSKNGRIVIFSEDYLNDTLEAEIRISEPYLKTLERTGSANKLILPIDGTPVGIGGTFGYMSYDGSAQLEKSSFDPVLYDARLAFPAGEQNGWAEYAGFDEASLKLYCRKTTGARGNLEDADYDSEGMTYFSSDRTFILNANPATGLYSGRVFSVFVDYSKLVIRHFGTDGVGLGDGVFKLRYFIETSSRYDGVDVLTEDEDFELYANYAFRGSDISSLEIDWDGEATHYTCERFPYETFGPTLDLITDERDTGGGGRLRWRYDESHQVMKSQSGEDIPGGLLLPYGEQRLTFRYRNRWDGRDFLTEGTIELCYSTDFCVFVGATRRQNAQVFIVPTKNVKYLLRCAPTATRAQRSWMTRLFGHRNWSDHMTVGKAYPHLNTGGLGYWVTYPTPKTFPLTDFSYTYLPAYSGSGWSAAGISALYERLGEGNSRFYEWIFGDVQFPSGYSHFEPGLDQFQLAWRSNPRDLDSQHVFGLYIDTDEAFAD